jgi:hypothetical protein
MSRTIGTLAFKCSAALLLLTLIVSVSIAYHRATICVEPRIHAEIKSLEAVLEMYRRDFGSYPPLDNPVIVKALTGSNPAKKAYYDFRKNQINNKGELLDPWRTPYHFYMEKDGPVIVSAGQDKQFFDNDDESNLRK